MSSNNRITTAWLALCLAALTGCATVSPGPDPVAPAKQAATDPLHDDYNRALDMLKQGNDAEALALFETLSQSRPDLAAPFINIGLIALKRDDLHAAEAAFLHASTLKPELAVIHNGLGITYRRQGRFAEAETAYLKALQCAPDYASAHLNLAILYDVYLGRLDAALEHYERYRAQGGTENDTASKWVLDLKQRLSANTESSIQ